MQQNRLQQTSAKYVLTSRFRLLCTVVVLGSCLNLYAGNSEVSCSILLHLQTHLSNMDIDWPLQWQREYIRKIEAVLRPYENKPDYALRAQVFCDGLDVYNPGRNTPLLSSRAGFEYNQAKMRWFIEILMSGSLPSDADKEQL